MPRQCRCSHLRSLRNDSRPETAGNNIQAPSLPCAHGSAHPKLHSHHTLSAGLYGKSSTENAERRSVRQSLQALEKQKHDGITRTKPYVGFCGHEAATCPGRGRPHVRGPGALPALDAHQRHLSPEQRPDGPLSCQAFSSLPRLLALPDARCSAPCRINATVLRNAPSLPPACRFRKKRCPRLPQSGRVPGLSPSACRLSRSVQKRRLFAALPAGHVVVPGARCVATRKYPLPDHQRKERCSVFVIWVIFISTS